MKYLYDNLSNKVSKITTNEYSTSFSFSSKLLSKNIRPAIYSIYGLVRLADEIVDSFHGYDKKELLEKLKSEYDYSIKNKISLNPILNSFQKVYHKYNFEPHLVESFFKSMEMDLHKKNYTAKSYNEYIYGSAEVVGLMCLKVFVKGDNKKYQDLKSSAMKLGAAFQKVNFLRDLKYDNDNLGRNYFPKINFNKINTDEKNEIIKEINSDFDDALTGLKKLDKDSYLGVYVAYRYYKELLKKIDKMSINQIQNNRIRINNFKKASLMLNSAIRTNLSL